MRSRTLPISRITTRILRWATTIAASCIRRTRSADYRKTILSVQRRSIRLRTPRRLRQLTAHPQSARNKNPLQLGALIDPAQAALREACERTRAVRQQPIEGIDREAHELGLTFTPALVAPEHAQRPGILARLAGG